MEQCDGDMKLRYIEIYAINPLYAHRCIYIYIYQVNEKLKRAYTNDIKRKETRKGEVHTHAFIHAQIVNDRV